MYDKLNTATTLGTDVFHVGLHVCDWHEKFLTYLDTLRMQPEFSFSSETSNGTTVVRCFCAFRPLRRIRTSSESPRCIIAACSGLRGGTPIPG